MNPYLVSGVTGAAPIWNDIMSYILKDKEDLQQQKPNGIEEVSVCSMSGAPQTAESTGCTARREYFWNEKLPDFAQVEKKNIWIKKETGQPAFFGSTTSKQQEAVDTEGLELQEHTVVSDPFTREVCLDCAPPPENPESGKIPFPQVNVDMNLFYWDGGFEKLDY